MQSEGCFDPFGNDHGRKCKGETEGIDGILVAPGFGPRGIEGKITAIRYARLHKLPFFGICLGMQCAVIEFGRNVLGYKRHIRRNLIKQLKIPLST